MVQFASYLRRVLCKTPLIFPHINGPIIFVKELWYVLTKDFVSCVNTRFYFFTAAFFHLAANMYYFLTAAMKFSCFSFNQIRLPSPFSVIHASLNIRNNGEKDTTLLLFFFSLKVRSAMRFSSFAFGLPYLLIELFYIGVPVVTTDGRSVGRAVYGHVITKFSRMGRFT